MFRKQSPERIKKLEKTFPFLKDIITMETGTYHPNVEIYIKVERMDSNLMYFRGDRVDGEIVSLVGENGLRGSKFERVEFWGEKGKPKGGMSWSTRGQGARVKDWFDVRTKNDIAELKYITKITVIDWHEQNKPEVIDEGGRDYRNLGAWVRREIYIVIYQPPKQGGVDALLKETSLMSNVRLNKDELDNAQINKERDFDRVMQDLDVLADEFMFNVYVRGFDRVVIECSKPRMKGTFGNIELATWHMSGNIIMTFKSGGSMITLMGTDEDYPPSVHVKSIDATLPEAQRMVRTVIEHWQKLPKVAIPKAMRSFIRQDAHTSYCGITNP